MPALNLLILSRIIRMASLVAANSDTNKMTPSNLSIVLGPNLLWLPDHHFSSLTVINKLAKLLVVNSDYIFGDSIAPGSSDVLATEGSQEATSIHVSTETSSSVPVKEELKEKAEDMSSAEISDEATQSEEEEVVKEITKKVAEVAEVVEEVVVVDMKDEEAAVVPSSSCSSLCSSISNPEVLASNLNAISEGEREAEAEAVIEDEATEVKLEQETVAVGQKEEESKKEEEVVEDKENIDMTPAEL
jgi:hypothetical protein